MIDRRTLLRRVAAFGPVACQTPASAQGRQARIGYLSSRRVPNEFEQAFERGLRERGLAPGKGAIVEYRFSAGDAGRESDNIASIAAFRPDVVVLGDSMVARRTLSLNDFGVPIVVVAFGDPVLSALTTSLARPDGNMTGSAVFNVELSHKRLELLKQAVPGLQRAAALFNVRRRIKPLGVSASAEAGEKLGVKVTELGVTLPEGLQDALAQAVRDGVQGVAIVSDTATITHRAPICDATLAHKMPTIFSNRTYLRAGGLMSYGPDLEAVFHRAAYYVDRILHGAKPAELPIEQVTAFRLVLSQRTARAIGIQFPKSLLIAADEVLE